MAFEKEIIHYKEVELKYGIENNNNINTTNNSHNNKISITNKRK